MVTFAKGHVHDFATGAKRDDYIKLISPGGTKTKCAGMETVDTLEEDLFVEYGWRFNEGTPDELVPRDIRYMFEKEERKVFRIRWIKHDFQFQENGEISLKVNYQAVPEFAIYQDVSWNDVFNIEDEKALLKFSVESADLQQKLNRLKELKEKQKQFQAMIYGCGASQGDVPISGECPETKEHKKQRKEHGIETAEEEKNRVLKELKEEEREALSTANKEIKVLKVAIALAMQKAMLARFAHEGQLFRAGFTSYRDASFNFKIRTGIKKVTTDKVLKSSLQAVKSVLTEGAAAAAEAAAKTADKNDQWYKQQENKFGDLFMPGFDDDPKAKVFEHSYPNDSILREFNTIVKSPKNKKKYKQLNDIIKKADPGYTDKQRMASILCALTNCGFAAPSEEAGQGMAKKTYGNFFFFPLRALISWVYDIAGEEGRSKMPSVCLGNVITRAMGKDFWVNLGDILIEVQMFQKWYYRNVISAGRTKWTFGDFMDSIIQDLVPRALNGYPSDNYPAANYGAISLKTLEVDTFWSPAWYVMLKQLAKRPRNISDFKIQGFTIDKLVSDIKDRSWSADSAPLLFYTQFPDASMTNTEIISPLLKDLGIRNFSKPRDHADGMYHLTIGEDRGILKKIDFKYMDNSALRTALWLDNKVDGAAQFLRQPYEASPTLIGNNLFTNGAFFVISHNPLGITPEEDPGLRGYYQINRVTDTITMGQYITATHGVNMTPFHDGRKKKSSESNKCGAKQKDKLSEFKTHVVKSISDYIINDLTRRGDFIMHYFAPPGKVKPAKKKAKKGGKPPTEKEKEKEEKKDKGKKKCAAGQIFDSVTQKCKERPPPPKKKKGKKAAAKKAKKAKTKINKQANQYQQSKSKVGK
tara:strand:- start:1153 stop:3759 length:2607 start_codon:yes stop_codon:yes gene_type:complete